MLDGSVAGVQIKVTPSPKSATCWEPWATNCTTGIISQSRRFWVLYPYPFKVPSACCSTVNRTRVRPSLSDWSCSSVYRLLSPKLDGHSNATTPTNAPAATPVVAPDATAPAAHKPPQDTPLAVAVATPPNRSVPSEAGRVPLIFLRGMFPCASVSRPPSKANSPYWLRIGGDGSTGTDGVNGPIWQRATLGKDASACGHFILLLDRIPTCVSFPLVPCIRRQCSVPSCLCFLCRLGMSPVAIYPITSQGTREEIFSRHNTPCAN